MRKRNNILNVRKLRVFLKFCFLIDYLRKVIVMQFKLYLCIRY
jgi:hypothetical protein